jgi:hypothetical protein
MNHSDSLVDHLLRTVRCSSCEASYEPDGVNVLGHQDELWFVTVRCSRCQTQGLIAALVREGADTAARSPAATPPDEPRPASGTPISEDDVVDMHKFLVDFRGGIDELLSKG